jgi:hypothetical protein
VDTGLRLLLQTGGMSVGFIACHMVSSHGQNYCQRVSGTLNGGHGERWMYSSQAGSFIVAEAEMRIQQYSVREVG